MNLLAHAHLGSKFDSKVNCVNVLWDFIAKDLRSDKRSFIQSGGTLHNTIDSLTDNSTEFKKARQLISPSRKKIAGIIIDIGFDYILSKNWGLYSNTDIRTFVNEILSDLYLYTPELSEKAGMIQQKIYRTDWFGDYMNIDRLPFVFERVSRRFSKDGIFNNADIEIKNNLSELEELFHPFYQNMLSLINNRATGDKISRIMSGQRAATEK